MSDFIVLLVFFFSILVGWRAHTSPTRTILSPFHHISALGWHLKEMLICEVTFYSKRFMATLLQPFSSPVFVMHFPWDNFRTINNSLPHKSSSSRFVLWFFLSHSKTANILSRLNNSRRNTAKSWSAVLVLKDFDHAKPPLILRCVSHKWIMMTNAKIFIWIYSSLMTVPRYAEYRKWTMRIRTEIITYITICQNTKRITAY